jgi:hypothetical protein
MSKRKRPMTLERAEAKFLHHRVIFRENGTDLFLTGTCTGVRKLGSAIVADVSSVAGRGSNRYTLPIKDIRKL